MTVPTAPHLLVSQVDPYKIDHLEVFRAGFNTKLRSAGVGSIPVHKNITMYNRDLSLDLLKREVWSAVGATANKLSKVIELLCSQNSLRVRAIGGNADCHPRFR